jgi:hypothetical protein
MVPALADTYVWVGKLRVFLPLKRMSTGFLVLLSREAENRCFLCGFSLRRLLRMESTPDLRIFRNSFRCIWRFHCSLLFNENKGHFLFSAAVRTRFDPKNWTNGWFLAFFVPFPLSSHSSSLPHCDVVTTAARDVFPIQLRRSSTILPSLSFPPSFRFDSMSSRWQDAGRELSYVRPHPPGAAAEARGIRGL